MTLQAPMRCSALAEELDEPMAGTVAQRLRWLLVEDRGAWGTDAVKDLLGADAAARAKALRLRLLLVRRREADPPTDVVRRTILVDTERREMATRSVRGLSKVSVDEAASVPVADYGEPLDGPLFLVCTNGKRDACCALRGRGLVGALAAEHGDRVWECTHLGGHRFAANLVCLPDGIVYGRVGPEDGSALVRAYLARRLDAAHLRGRSAWPAPAQVAEVAVRTELALTGVDDLRLETAEVEGTSARVVVSVPGGEARTVELRAERGDPRPISCRADELEEPLHWRVVRSSASHPG